MSQDLDDLIFDLSFYSDYHQEKQTKRLNAHLETAASISSFLYDEREREIDTHIHLLRRAHVAIQELSKKKTRKQRFIEALKK